MTSTLRLDEIGLTGGNGVVWHFRDEFVHYNKVPIHLSNRNDHVIHCPSMSAGGYIHIQDWLNHGGDLFNRRYANKEDKISPKTASKLSLKWKFYAGKDISATPAIYDDTIYFPCWNGNIYAVKKDDGKLVWKQNLNELTGLKATGFVMNVNTTVSRSTPTIAGNGLLIVGVFGPAIVLGLNRKNGKLVWLTYLDHHPAALITMSGTYYKGLVYKCCIFRGSMVKLNAFSGKIIWQTYMLPDNNGELGGYAGAAIWGSSPSIDAQRNNVYIATGNLYSAPARILECQERQDQMGPAARRV
ncbi:uncharacterized protein LOC127746706 [Arachis duranensis]|uniref:Uncharacterized protein LOC127746706 n=1 Tax=Arachis duranensis TaxID=130453 RepID=A0A9C6WV67_ARADU|nr:uncharacterized protein LOC127746706 [Arachis duranensis]